MRSILGIRKCFHCGVEFTARTDNPTQRLCSRTCASAAFAAQKLATRTHGTTAMYKHGCRCDDCRKANSNASRAWHEAHPGWRANFEKKRTGTAKRKQAKKRSHAKHREAHLAAMRAWYKKNREHARQKRKAWMLANPDKRREHRQNYEFRSRNARGYATAEQITARAAYYGNQCFYCGGPYEDIDHSIPLIRGGTNWPANLRPACGHCNSRKCAMTLLEFSMVLKAERSQ